MTSASDIGAGHPPVIGWSDFARDRYRPGGGRSLFRGSESELIEMVLANWEQRRPGAGRATLDEVVVVPLPPDRFVCGTVRIDQDTPLHVEFQRRQPHEQGYARITAEGEPETAAFAGVVLYSADTLELGDGRRSGNYEWEIVCVLASPVPDEPMDPLTMARNMLVKPGGTPCDYSARDFAEAIWYWSTRADCHAGDIG